MAVLETTTLSRLKPTTSAPVAVVLARQNLHLMTSYCNITFTISILVNLM